MPKHPKTKKYHSKVEDTGISRRGDIEEEYSSSLPINSDMDTVQKRLDKIHWMLLGGEPVNVPLPTPGNFTDFYEGVKHLGTWDTPNGNACHFLESVAPGIDAVIEANFQDELHTDFRFAAEDRYHCPISSDSYITFGLTPSNSSSHDTVWESGAHTHFLRHAVDLSTKGNRAKDLRIKRLGENAIEIKGYPNGDSIVPDFILILYKKGYLKNDETHAEISRYADKYDIGLINTAHSPRQHPVFTPLKTLDEYSYKAFSWSRLFGSNYGLTASIHSNELDGLINAQIGLLECNDGILKLAVTGIGPKNNALYFEITKNASSNRLRPPRFQINPAMNKGYLYRYYSELNIVTTITRKKTKAIPKLSDFQAVEGQKILMDYPEPGFYVVLLYHQI